MKLEKQRKTWGLAFSFIAALFVMAAFLPAPASAETAYDLQWLKQPVGSDNPGYASALAVGRGGTLYVAGQVKPEKGWRAVGLFLAKYSASGQQLWMKKTIWEGLSDIKLVLDAGGNIFLTGSKITPLDVWPPADTSDAILAKFTATGEMLWVKQIATPVVDRSAGVAVDAAGHVFVAGSTYGSLEPGKFNMGAADMFVRAFDAASGEELWTKQFGSTEYEQGCGISADGSGNLFIAGSSTGAFGADRTNGMTTSFLFKLSATTGDMAWVKLFGREIGDSAAALTIDAKGNVLVTGYTYGPMEEGRIPSGEIELYVAKLSGTSGATLWVKQTGAKGSDNISRGIAADSSGDVFVTGEKDVFVGGGAGMDTLLTKFAGATGQQLWEVRLSDAVMNYGTALGVDSLGDIAVLGMAYGPLVEGQEPGPAGFYFAKYGTTRTPAERIAVIINDLEQAIAAETISGSGPGNSRGKEKALLNMLLSSEKIIASGDTAAACRRLNDLSRKFGGVSPPADFVEGPDLMAIAEGVVSLERSMACP